MYDTKNRRMKTIRCPLLLVPHKLCMCLLLIFIHCQLFAQEVVQAHHGGNVKGFEINQIDSIVNCQFEEDYRFQFFMKDTILTPISIDSITFTQYSDTVYLSYTDAMVTYNNPCARFTHIDIDKCNERFDNFYKLHNLEVDRLKGHKNLSSIAI